MTNGDTRAAFLHMAQAIPTLAESVTTKAQVMKTQANREVLPIGNKQVGTMASIIRDFTSMNPPTFYGSKVEDDPQ